jgi:hypothetical protein
MRTIVDTGGLDEDGRVALLLFRLRLDEAMKPVQKRRRIVDLAVIVRLDWRVGVTFELPAIARDRQKKVSKRRER